MTRLLISCILCLFGFQALSQTVVRGPYLQSGTATGLIVKWRTNSSTDSKVWYGPSPTNLNQTETVTGSRTNHEVQISGLSPSTQYYYAIGNAAGQIEGGDNNYSFITSPVTGSSPVMRFWVLGDCGTANSDQAAVRDAYLNYMNGQHTDGVLLLGDNAYNSGTDNEYQNAIFNMYESSLKKYVFWSTPGNHDYYSASASNESGPYFDIFSFPRNGEAGGLASGTEAYYSFDVGNVHIVSLDSHDSDRSPGGDMLTWLTNDLSATLQDWIIVIFHHPPYTKGSHDSDSNSDSGGRMNDMRENVLPILESYGVDLVLSGHSHSYERSYLINGHYGYSNTYNPATMAVDGGSGQANNDGAYEKEVTGPNAGLGAVYITAGSSGKISGGQLNHPVMYYSANTLGSLAIEVDDDRLHLEFVNSNGNVDDYFTINKFGYIGNPPTVSITSPLDDTYYPTLQTINIQADAQDSDGTISQVEFFVDGNSIGTDNSAPYSMNYAIPAFGSYSITAKATDNDNNEVASAPISILVGTINTVASLGVGSDDAEQNSSGGVNITSTDLELTTDGTSVQTVGVRFTKAIFHIIYSIRISIIACCSSNRAWSPDTIAVTSREGGRIVTILSMNGHVGGTSA